MNNFVSSPVPAARLSCRLSRRSAFAAAVLVGSVSLTASRSQAALVLPFTDNFSEYTSGTTIANNSATYSTAFPYQETGGGLTDPLTATTLATYEVDGSEAGVVAVSFASANNETLRYKIPTGASNLFSTYGSSFTESVGIKSSVATTATVVEALITDGNSIYASSVSQPLNAATPATSAKTLTFAIDAADLVETGGTESLSTVLSGVTEFGIVLVNTSASTTSESDSIDNLSLAVAPEPASVGLLGVGAAAMLLRRRRVLSGI